ncbi:retrovirus-related pol polyprotein from transposon TNT 1-94 [Tanacetum coccineum]
MCEKYFEKRSSEVSINFAAQQVHNNEESPLKSSIIVEEQEAPPIVSTSKEQTSLISLNNADEFNQEDSADFDAPNFEDSGNIMEICSKQVLMNSTKKTLQILMLHDDMVFIPYDAPNFEEAKSSTITLYLSNMHDTFEPKNIKEAMSDHSWIESMQDELLERLDVWELVSRPDGKNIIAIKWLWKNKNDADNIVIQNKSRLVGKGYKFSRPCLQVKESSIGLKQALRAWYDKLSSFLIEHHFTKGIVEPNLFTRRHGEDILLVQVYVDSIIFGFTNPDFSKRFANLMKNNFEMSMMGELNFFLGFQVHQSPSGIFISQSQYAIKLLKKHGMDDCVSMSTPMATERLDAGLQGTPTNQTTYCRMIGGLMYLTASRPDIAFSTFVCAGYQARPTVKNLKETMPDVKTIANALQEAYNF